MKISGLGRSGLLVAVSLVMAGCGSSGPSEQAVEHDGTPTPTDVTFHNVWSAEEGIDLGSRSAELIRATAEAADLASLRGGRGLLPGIRIDPRVNGTQRQGWLADQRHLRARG